MWDYLQLVSRGGKCVTPNHKLFFLASLCCGFKFPDDTRISKFSQHERRVKT